MNRHMNIEERMKCKNKAERQFENEFNYLQRDKGGICIKYGLNNIELPDESYQNLRHIPSFIRNTPDFLCVKSNEFYMVEVKGCGKNLWLKMPDFDNYKIWSNTFPLYFYILQNKTERYAYKSVYKMEELIDQNSYQIKQHWDSWKKCWIIPFEDLL